jgi:hypothetical protein
MIRPALSLGGLLLLAACAAPRLVPPAAPPAPAPVAMTPVPPAPPAPARGWEDTPVEPGRWVYRLDGQDSLAQFFHPRRHDRASLRCERATRRVVLSMAAATVPSPSITIRTSYGDLAWSADSLPGGGRIGAGRAATDPGLDWIAFSRGRFALEAAGNESIVLPAWAEVARVIEDCRG